MTRYERSAQIWSLLVLAAKVQKILSYKAIEGLTGLPRQGVGASLGPIQEYCRRKDLPPLTSLVVSEDTGMPGVGFSGAVDAFSAQARCFVFDWTARDVPTVEDFEATKPDR